MAFISQLKKSFML